MFKAKTSAGRLGIVVFVALVVLFVVWQWPRPDQPDPEQDTPTISAPRFRPEQTVLATRGFACSTEDLLQRAVTFAQAQDSTQFEAMFSRFECMALPTGVTYKVRAVHGHFVHVVAASDGKPNGRWTLRSFIVAEPIPK